MFFLNVLDWEQNVNWSSTVNGTNYFNSITFATIIIHGYPN